jgi:hypothetical protein
MVDNSVYAATENNRLDESIGRIVEVAHPEIVRMSNDATNGYAEVNGLRMYYEVHRTGRPLVLLHSAFGTIERCFAGLLPEPEGIPRRRAPRRASGRLAERIRAP